MIVVAVRRRTLSAAVYALPMGLELGPEILFLADVFRRSAIPVLTSCCRPLISYGCAMAGWAGTQFFLSIMFRALWGSSASSRRNSHMIVAVMLRRTFNVAVYALPMGLQLRPMGLQLRPEQLWV